MFNRRAKIALNVGATFKCVVLLTTPTSTHPVTSQKVLFFFFFFKICCQKQTLCMSSPTGVWSEVNHTRRFQLSQRAVQQQQQQCFCRLLVLDCQAELWQPNSGGQQREHSSQVSAESQRRFWLLPCHQYTGQSVTVPLI